MDNVYKLLNVLMPPHEIVRGGGEYIRKGFEQQESTKRDFREARDYYKEKISKGKSTFDEVIDKLGDGADKLFDKIGDTFKDLLAKPIFNLTGSCLHWDFRIFFIDVGLRLT